jgi:NCS2 family nucleobase:cation symporter-2
MSMLAIAVASLLQAFPLGRFGSGYLVPGFCSVNYFPASMLAAAAGGMPLVFGMTILAGCFEIGLASALRRLRVLFPPEVAGVTVLLVGLEAGFIGLDQLVHPTGLVGPEANVGIGLATFGVAAAVSVFGGPAFRLYAALIGMAAGVVLAASLGAIAPDGWRHLDAEPWLALPRLGHLAWTISPDPTLLLAFGLAAFAATLKTIGAVSTAQRLNDADWSRPDAGNLRRGVFGDGLASICAGLLGSTGQNSATSAVGISGATGATSRWIALTLAGWLAAMACMPKLAALFELMPGMVLGGVLAFAAIYMVANGIELIGSRVLDRRRALVVGAAIIAATSFRAMPELALALPAALQPFASSGLALGMVVAVVLNLVFRIGIHRRARLVVADLSQAEREIAAFLAVQAGLWGLRQELLARAVLALGHLLRCDGEAPQGHSRLTVEASYDELRLVLFLRRATTVPVLVPAERPSSPGRSMTLQVPGAELATVQRAVGSVCLRLELDA